MVSRNNPYVIWTGSNWTKTGIPSYAVVSTFPSSTTNTSSSSSDENIHKNLRDVINNVSSAIDSEISEETVKAEVELDEHGMFIAGIKKAIKDEILYRISHAIGGAGFKLEPEALDKKVETHLENIFSFLSKFEENLKFITTKELRDRITFEVMEDFKSFILTKKINGKVFDVEKFETYWEKKLISMGHSIAPNTKK